MSAERHYLDDIRLLRDGREQLRAVFDASTDALIVSDDDGRLLETNRAATALLGRAPDDLRGRRLADFLVSQSASPQPHGAEGPDTVPIEVVREDGSIRIVEHRAAMHILPGRHLSILREVNGRMGGDTERERAAALVASADQAIIGVDLDGTINAWNPAAARLYGMREHEAVGTHLTRFLPAEGSDSAYALARTIASGRSIDCHDAVHQTATGEAIEVSVSASPLRGARGHVTGGALFIRDVGRERAEQRATAHAEQLDRMGQFAGTMAHDFRNLLTAVVGYADLVLRNLGPTEGRVRQDALNLRSVADRAVRLTAELEPLSRTRRASIVPLDLGRAVRALQPLLARLAGGSIELRLERVDPPGVDDGLWVCIEPAALEQLLLTFVLNARDALPDGGAITIQLGRDPSAPERIVLIVADTGDGIAPEVRERLFEPLVSTRDGHRGLGLATAYALVRSAGGTLCETGQPGGGARFVATLPEAPPWLRDA